MARYKAIARGYDGVKVREIDEVFEFEGPQGSWMEALDAPKQEVKAPSKPKGQKPSASASLPGDTTDQN